MSMTITHAATNIGTGTPTYVYGALHMHTAEYLCDSGTGNATVIHYGRNGGVGSWHTIWTATFTAAASGAKQVAALEHAWAEYKSECTVLTGTGGRVLSTMSGA
jgi:hypothetical protein